MSKMKKIAEVRDAGFIGNQFQDDDTFINSVDSSNIELDTNPFVEDVKKEEIVVEEIKEKKPKNKPEIVASIKRGCKVLFVSGKHLYIRFEPTHDIRYPYTKGDSPKTVNVAYTGTFGKPDFTIVDIEVD